MRYLLISLWMCGLLLLSWPAPSSLLSVLHGGQCTGGAGNESD